MNNREANYNPHPPACSCVDCQRERTHLSLGICSDCILRDSLSFNRDTLGDFCFHKNYIINNFCKYKTFSKPETTNSVSNIQKEEMPNEELGNFYQVNNPNKIYNTDTEPEFIDSTIDIRINNQNNNKRKSLIDTLIHIGLLLRIIKYK